MTQGRKNETKRAPPHRLIKPLEGLADESGGSAGVGWAGDLISAGDGDGGVRGCSSEGGDDGIKILRIDAFTANDSPALQIRPLAGFDLLLDAQGENVKGELLPNLKWSLSLGLLLVRIKLCFWVPSSSCFVTEVKYLL